jgi:hypothetical protein
MGYRKFAAKRSVCGFQHLQSRKPRLIRTACGASYRFAVNEDGP